MTTGGSMMETQFSGKWWHIIAEAAYLLFMSLVSLVLIAILWWTPAWLGLDVTELTGEESENVGGDF